MPDLMKDFLDPSCFHALTTSIGYGLMVLVGVSVTGAALTFLTGGTQPKKWPQSEH